MKFFTPNLSENAALNDAIDNYQEEFNEGNYVIDPEKLWGSEDEKTLIRSRLQRFANNLSNEEWSTLKQKIDESPSVGLGPILNLLAIVHLLKKQEDLKSDDALQLSKEIDVQYFVRAGMPGPCLLYLNALKEDDSILTSVKQTLVDDLITKLVAQQNSFGILSEIVLKVAIENQRQIIRQPEEESNQIKLQKYSELEQKLSSVDELKSKMTGIDSCILGLLRQFKNNMGQNFLSEQHAAAAAEKISLSSNPKVGF